MAQTEKGHGNAVTTFEFTSILDTSENYYHDTTKTHTIFYSR